MRRELRARAGATNVISFGARANANGNEIDAARMKRVAARQSHERHESAAHRTVLAHCVERVLRARGIVAASGRQNGDTTSWYTRITATATRRTLLRDQRAEFGTQFFERERSGRRPGNDEQANAAGAEQFVTIAAMRRRSLFRTTAFPIDELTVMPTSETGSPGAAGAV